MKMKKRNKLTFSMIGLMLIASFAFLCAAFFSLTMGQASIHSDTATSSILARAVYRQHSFIPRTWTYAHMDVWTITIGLFVLPFPAIIPDQSVARMIGTVFSFLIGSLSIVYACKKGWKNDAWGIIIPVILLFMTGQLDIQYMQAGYTSYITEIPFATLMIYLITQKTEKKRYYVFYSIFLFVYCMGGIRQVAEHVIPVWLASMLLVWSRIRNEEKIDLKENIKECFRRSIWIAIPAVAGLAAYASVLLTHNVTGIPKGSGMQLPDSMGDIISILISIISGIYSTMGYQGGTSLFSVEGISSIVSMVMCSIVVFIVPVLQAMKLKDEDEFTRFFFFFTVVHNIIMIFMSIFFGYYTTSYYMVTSIYACMILSGRYIYVSWIKQKSIARYAWFALFIIAIFIQGVSLISKTSGWKEKLAEAEALPQELASMGLTKGYADYWNAYNNEVYSDFKTLYCGIEISDANVRPYYFLNDSSIYEPSEGKSFILLEESDFNRIDMMEEKFGKAEQILDRGKYKVLIFDHDIAMDMRNVLDDNVIEYSEFLPVVPYDELKYTDDAVVLKSGQQVNSEFVPLNAGTYILECDVDRPENMSVAVVSRTHRWGAVSLTEIEAVEGKRRFELILKNDQPLMEFRVVNNGTESLSVYNISVTKE